MLAVAVLAGCAADAPPRPTAPDSEKRWVGYFESSLGPLGCPGRGTMAVAIDGGKIAGEAQGNGFVMSVSGVLGLNGAVRDGIFRREDRAAAIVTGTFLENDAAGRWQGRSCEGIWMLRRIAQ